MPSERDSGVGPSRLISWTVVVAALMAASCGSPDGDLTPGLSSGPAFVVVRTRQGPCETGTCAFARIKNVGSRPGSGTCKVWGLVDGSDEVIEGPTTHLAITEPGDTFVQGVEWQGEVPSGGFSWDCSPTLQS